MHGNKVAESCGTVLGNIVVNTEDLSEKVESIASASQEQSAGVAEIGKAIHLLDTATQVNAAETENTAVSAKHLGGEVESLNSAIYRLQTMITGRGNSAGTIVNAFIWRDRYALGVTAMDDEHKILIEKINALVTGINNDVSLPDLKVLFDHLAEYTKEHFSDEEKYLASIKYPQITQHKGIHRKLLERVAQFGSTFDNGTLDSSALVAFLNNWLIKHILGVDMRYANFSRTGTSEDLVVDDN